MSTEAFVNALRLHSDSILLYKHQSFASAYFLSVLALEEIGKVTLLEDFVWRSHIERRMSAADEEDYISGMFKHQHKQARFARHADDFLPKKVMESMRNGKIENCKQNAVYVGLNRKKGKVNLKGKIVSPLNLQQRKAKEQITIVHDYLLTFTLGVVKEVYRADTEHLEAVIDKSLVVWLKRLWKERSYRAGRIINRLEKVTW